MQVELQKACPAKSSHPDPPNVPWHSLTVMKFPVQEHLTVFDTN
jgi:hypothetical protein